MILFELLVLLTNWAYSGQNFSSLSDQPSDCVVQILNFSLKRSNNSIFLLELRVNPFQFTIPDP